MDWLCRKLRLWIANEYLIFPNTYGESHLKSNVISSVYILACLVPKVFLVIFAVTNYIEIWIFMHIFRFPLVHIIKEQKLMRLKMGVYTFYPERTVFIWNMVWYHDEYICKMNLLSSVTREIWLLVK